MYEWQKEIIKAHEGQGWVHMPRRMSKTSLLNAIYDFKQELNGVLMDDETGIDLSQVPVCPRCGLEIANRVEHETWHQQQNEKIQALERAVEELKRELRQLLADTHSYPVPPNNPWDDRLKRQRWDDLYEPHWISDDEIKKYGSKDWGKK